MVRLAAPTAQHRTAPLAVALGGDSECHGRGEAAAATASPIYT